MWGRKKHEISYNTTGVETQETSVPGGVFCVADSEGEVRGKEDLIFDSSVHIVIQKIECSLCFLISQCTKHQMSRNKFYKA